MKEKGPIFDKGEVSEDKPITSQEYIYDRYILRDFSKYKIKKILNYFPKKKDVILLDVGCGEGLFSKHINKEVINYFGMDISKIQVKKAKERGLNVIVHDLSKKWPFQAEFFDVVLASEIIEHIYDTDFFLRECYRVLKKKGILILTTPNIAYLGSRLRLLIGRRPPVIDIRVNKKTSGHIRAFTYHDLKVLLKDNNFILDKFSGLDFYLPFVSQDTKNLGFFCYQLSNIFPTLSAGIILRGRKKIEE